MTSVQRGNHKGNLEAIKRENVCIFANRKAHNVENRIKAKHAYRATRPFSRCIFDCALKGSSILRRTVERPLHRIAQNFNASWTSGQVLSFRFNMAEEDRATTSSIKIPTWDGTEGEKAQTHVTKLESAAELGGYAEALEMSFENALPSSETQAIQTDDEKKAVKLNKKARAVVAQGVCVLQP